MTDPSSRTALRRRKARTATTSTVEPGPDPFAPGAVEVAVPELPPVPPPPRPINLVVATVVICAAIVVSIGVFGRWATRVAGYTAGALAGGMYVLGAVRSEARGSQVRAAGIALLVMLAVVLPGVIYFYGLTPTLLGTGVFAAGALAWRSDARARAAVQNAQGQRELLVRSYQGAQAWNRVREALRDPATHLEQNLGAPNFDEQLRIRAADPATGATALRTLDEPLERDGWLVVDADGVVVATAPRGAPDQWQRATGPSWPVAPPS